MSGELDFNVGLDLNQLKRDAQKVQNEFAKISNKAEVEGSRIDRTFNRIGGAIAGYFGAQQLISFGKAIIDTRAEFQKFGIVLENTLGSKVEADNALNMVSEFAANTPFALTELSDAFIRLTNQGLQPSREELTKMGDLASSTGKGFIQLTEAIIDAQTGEFERLKEFGIKASKEGDKITFTFKGQKTVIDASAKSIKDYIVGLGDLKGVAGANEKIAKSLSGQISNLGDSWDQFLNQLGQGSEGLISGTLKALTNGLGDITDSIKVLNNEKSKSTEKTKAWTNILSKANPVLWLLNSRLKGAENGFLSLLPNMDRAIAKLKEFFNIGNDKGPSAKGASLKNDFAERVLSQMQKRVDDEIKRQKEAAEVKNELSEKELEERQKAYEKEFKQFEDFVANQKDRYQQYNADIEDLSGERLQIVQKEYSDLTLKGKTYLDFLQSLLATEKDRNKQVLIEKEIKTVISQNVVDEQKNKQEKFNEEQEEIKAEKEKLELLAIEFESYQQKRLRLTADYAGKIKTLKDKGYIEQSEEARKTLVNELAELENSFLSNNNIFQSWTNEVLPQIIQSGAAKIREELSKLQYSLVMDDLNPEEVAQYKGKIDELNKALDDKLNKEKGGSDSWKDSLELMNGINELAKEIVGSFEDLDEETKAILIGITDMASGVINLFTGFEALSKAVTSLEKASAILAIIGTSIRIVSAITSIFKKQKAAEEEAERRRIQLQIEYNRALREQLLLMKQIETIFGKNLIQGAVASVSNYAAIMQDYFDVLNQIKEKDYMVYKGNVLFNQLDLLNRLYPGLVDEAGNLNLELARSVLATQDLSAANRMALEQLVSITEQAEKAQEALNNYLRDTFGSLGNELMTSLEQALKTGADAWEIFGDAGAKVLENLGKQIAYSLYFADIFKNLENELKAIYSSGKSEEEIANEAALLIESFYNGIGGQMDAAQNFMQQWDEKLQGFDLWETTNREAMQKGFASMSQDTAEELNGRFTAIQGHTFEINTNVKLLASNSSMILELLSGIHNHTERLQAIESDIHSVKVGIDNINTKGIFIKT